VEHIQRHFNSKNIKLEDYTHTPRIRKDTLRKNTQGIVNRRGLTHLSKLLPRAGKDTLIVTLWFGVYYLNRKNAILMPEESSVWTSWGMPSECDLTSLLCIYHERTHILDLPRASRHYWLRDPERRRDLVTVTVIRVQKVLEY
jgi:hypothetical protein